MDAQERFPDSLSLTFAALANPTRREILNFLKTGEASVKELAKPFQISQPAITKHLKILERANLIIRSRNAQFRLSQLEVEPLKEAAEWIEQYRLFWEKKFTQIDAYIKELNHQREEP